MAIGGEQSHLAGDGITIHTMSEQDNSQLEAAIRKEFGAKGKEGTNSEKEEASENAEPVDAQAQESESEQNGDTQEAKETEKTEEKRRSGVPKILRERNELRRKVQELESKLNESPEANSAEEGEEKIDLDAKIKEILRAEREQQETQQFFESNTEAKAKKKAIEALMDDHGLTVTDAWSLYLAKNDPKSLVKNSTKAYSSPSVPNFGNRKDKSVASMSTDDLESELRNLHKKGELSI